MGEGKGSAKSLSEELFYLRKEVRELVLAVKEQEESVRRSQTRSDGAYSGVSSKFDGAPDLERSEVFRMVEERVLGIEEMGEVIAKPVRGNVPRAPTPEFRLGRQLSRTADESDEEPDAALTAEIVARRATKMGQTWMRDGLMSWERNGGGEGVQEKVVNDRSVKGKNFAGRCKRWHPWGGP